MKQSSFLFLFLTAIVGCALIKQSRPIKPTPIADVEKILIPPKISGPIPLVMINKTPRYSFVMAKGQDYDLKVFKSAIQLIEAHANTDGFYKYMASKRTYFAHTKLKPIEAIKIFREQLNSSKTIEVKFYRPRYKSSAIGGWNGTSIYENMDFKMEAVRRAGHLLHETSHVYGWEHQGNYANRNDNRNSFPYAVGYDFEEYIMQITKKELAGGTK